MPGLGKDVNEPRSRVGRTRQQSLSEMSSSFIHESFTSSVDFPTYIPWQTLSSDLSEKLKHGSIRINRSNRVEYTTIHEEGERVPLIDDQDSTSLVKTEAVHGGASWGVATFLLVNTALGAGVLNYPAAYNRAGGVYVAAGLQVVILLLLGATMLVLARCSDLNCDNTYHDVLLSMCGKRAQQLSALSILFSCYGICITFLVIVGDQYDRLFASIFGNTFCHTWYLNRDFTILITAVVCILPMSYFQRLDFLRYASTLGLFAMLYPVFLTVYEYYMLDVVPGRIKVVPHTVVDVFIVIPVFSFAYQTHEIVVPVYSCMRNRNLKEFTKATCLSMIILFFIYCMAGSFGYLTFGTKVPPDIMQGYGGKDPVVLICIGALVIKMVTTYPQILLCGRGALDGFYAEFSKISTEQFIRGEKKRRIIITTFWFITTVLLSIFTPNITVVIELLGCLASANVFIFPGLCLLSMINMNDPDLQKWKSYVMLALSCIMVTFGAFVFGVLLLQVILVEFSGRKEGHEPLCL